MTKGSFKLRFRNKITKLKAILLTALRQGTSPKKLALTCALGAVVGIFPLWGTTTWLCFGLAFLFRLNIPIIQLVNYLFFPLQILLLLPFINAGTYIFNMEPLQYTTDQVVSMFQSNFWMTLKDTGALLATGVGVWALLSIPLFFVIFYFCFDMFRSMKVGYLSDNLLQKNSPR